MLSNVGVLKKQSNDRVKSGARTNAKRTMCTPRASPKKETTFACLLNSTPKHTHTNTHAHAACNKPAARSRHFGDGGRARQPKTRKGRHQHVAPHTKCTCTTCTLQPQRPVNKCAMHTCNITHAHAINKQHVRPHAQQASIHRLHPP